MKKISHVLLALLMLAPQTLLSSGAQPSHRLGYAYSADTGKLLYTESHRVVSSDDRQTLVNVEYRDAAGALLATKEVRFADQPLMPDFVLQNLLTGHVEESVREGAERTIRFRERSSAKLERTTLSAPPEGIIDAGFDRLIELHWDELVRGDTLRRPFLVPSRLAFYEFRIRREPSREPNEQVNVFLLELDSPLLRWLVEPVEVSYDARSRTLLEYRGVSNMRAPDGDNLKVRIDFSADAAAGISSATMVPEQSRSQDDRQ